MNKLSRRKLITTGLGATAGVSGLAVAGGLADRYGLIPPDCGGVYGAGHSLTYATHRLLTHNSMAREFSRSQISTPFPNGRPPQEEDFRRLEAGMFTDWRVAIDGMVTRPASFSLADIRRYPSSSQITQLTCEEGWSFIAEWIGAPLYNVLNAAGILPQARYVVYFSFQRRWWNSIDMADALHPQTLLTYGMNGGDLPVPHGGPLRLRVPRQLGYKNVKYITRLTVTDSLKEFTRKSSYSWYAGI
ncbi:MAG: molybdopterin-dependent oxidoreductase [Bryobacteraceae bacterium]